jgi:predicted metal-dependent hydrolase
MSSPGVPPELLEGARLHDEGQYWAAHEAWEALWRVEGDDLRRRFLQGLIQVTAAFHKLLVMRRPDAAARLLVRGLAKLDGLEDGYGGIDLARWREGARRCLEVVEGMAARGEGPEAFDRRLVPRLCD